MGHVCMIILVFLCQTIVYREVTRLFALMDSKPVEYGGKDPWSKTLSWYFFATANYFLYGESIIHYFKVPICVRLCPSLSRILIVACGLCGSKFPPVRRKP
jgi:Cytidylyltransferase family